MRAEVVEGYEAEEVDGEEYPKEFPFVLIKVIAEPTSGDGNTVASYIEYDNISVRKSRPLKYLKLNKLS